LNQRVEARALREAAAEEGEGASGTKKGFKKHFSRSIFQSQDEMQYEERQDGRATRQKIRKL
jgi:hypothetical protein